MQRKTLRHMKEKPQETDTLEEKNTSKDGKTKAKTVSCIDIYKQTIKMK